MTKKILIVDDMEMNRVILRGIVEEQFATLEASDGEEAINILEESKDDIALMFLDLQMPKVNGLEVLKYMQETQLINKIPVIMITGESTVESDVNAYELGVSDIIYKPFSVSIVIRRTLNLIELFEHRTNLEEKLQKRTAELRESHEKIKKNNDFLVETMISMLDFRSAESGEHIKRVRHLTGVLLNYLREFYPEYNINDEQAHMITMAAALHDIGKIAIPDAILLKPSKLTKSEFETMTTHTTIGSEMLDRVKQEDNEFYKYCYEICRYHHERYDGKGYPDKLKGEEIPIWAQIVSIVDVYDALVSERVYKAPYTFEEAIRMIHDGECGVFSPKILDCFDMAKADLFELAVNGNSVN